MSSSFMSMPATVSANAVKFGPQSRGALGGHRQRLAADQALEDADYQPQRAQAYRRATVDRRHARLGDDRAAAPVALDPVGEQDADRAGLVPGAERLGPVEARVVAMQRPDAPAQARQRPLLALVENAERVVGQQLTKGPAPVEARDAPAHDAAERVRVVEAQVVGSRPQP